MSFESDFPSLVEESRISTGWEHGWDEESLMKCCLDKQRVREAIWKDTVPFLLVRRTATVQEEVENLVLEERRRILDELGLGDDE